MDLKNISINNLLNQYPFSRKFFEDQEIELPEVDFLLVDYLSEISEEFWEDKGIDPDQLLFSLEAFIEADLKQQALSENWIDTVAILGGHNKSGEKEDVSLVFRRGSVTTIVGPTGSGKSRLLADIEWMAQGDSPTGRKVLIDGKEPGQEIRFSLEHKLVAQLSQNMNFVMDVSVREFLEMHAGCRKVKDMNRTIHDIVAEANRLSGEAFDMNTQVTSLSGGQSRALMITDTAFLSSSPIILIDEIENAGIDRKKALQLLVRNEKIVLMATHDPILALMGHQRLVIRNGGIAKILETSPEEQEMIHVLQKLDEQWFNLRHKIRMGERIGMADSPGI